MGVASPFTTSARFLMWDGLGQQKFLGETFRYHDGLVAQLSGRYPVLNTPLAYTR